MAEPKAGPLSPTELEALKRHDAPTVANAIETFNVRPRNAGFRRSREKHA